MKCPNCGGTHDDDAPDVCLVHALAGVLVSRGHDEALVLRRLYAVDVDELWETLGPLLDKLERDMDLNEEEDDDDA